MSMLAELVEVVIGVDTHTDTHTAVLVAVDTRAVLATAMVTADPDGYAELLEAVLSDLLARLAGRGIETSLDVDMEVNDLGLDETELLYRVAQEGLRNVVEHAEAGSVAITIRRHGPTLVMAVADDGRGIPAAPATLRSGHFGLRALAGLADGLGAALDLESTPGRGTVLRVEVPMA